MPNCCSKFYPSCGCTFVDTYNPPVYNFSFGDVPSGFEGIGKLYAGAPDNACKWGGLLMVPCLLRLSNLPQSYITNANANCVWFSSPIYIEVPFKPQWVCGDYGCAWQLNYYSPNSWARRISGTICYEEVEVLKYFGLGDFGTFDYGIQYRKDNGLYSGRTTSCGESAAFDCSNPITWFNDGGTYQSSQRIRGWGRPYGNGQSSGITIQSSFMLGGAMGLSGLSRKCCPSCMNPCHHPNCEPSSSVYCAVTPLRVSVAIDIVPDISRTYPEHPIDWTAIGGCTPTSPPTLYQSYENTDFGTVTGTVSYDFMIQAPPDTNSDTIVHPYYNYPAHTVDVVLYNMTFDINAVVQGNVYVGSMYGWQLFPYEVNDPNNPTMCRPILMTNDAYAMGTITATLNFLGMGKIRTYDYQKVQQAFPINYGTLQELMDLWKGESDLPYPC